MLSVAELFETASLEMCGPVQWLTPIEVTSSGVYVIGLVEPTSSAGNVSEAELAHWNAGEEIIYIGRATRLRRRIGQFYRHKYGRSAPHRGGQDIKLLTTAIQVYWACAADCVAAEHAMIDAFYSKVGALPFGNRMRGTRKRSATEPISTKVIPA